MKNLKLPWILAGYDLFAKEGPKGLKIEVIARRVKKSKSSFYHHFADLEVFTSYLLDYHMERATLVIDEERKCNSVVPELLQVLVQYKNDLLFNRQLRVYRNVPRFKEAIDTINMQSIDAIIEIWSEYLSLKANSTLATMVLSLTIENFYLQITEETMTYKWLEDYVIQLKRMTNEFGKTSP